MKEPHLKKTFIEQVQTTMVQISLDSIVQSDKPHVSLFSVLSTFKTPDHVPVSLQENAIRFLIVQHHQAEESENLVHCM